MWKLALLGFVYWARSQPSPLERARAEYLTQRGLIEEHLATLGVNSEAAAQIRAAVEASQAAFERGMTEGARVHVEEATRILRSEVMKWAT